MDSLLWLQFWDSIENGINGMEVLRCSCKIISVWHTINSNFWAFALTDMEFLPPNSFFEQWDRLWTRQIMFQTGNISDTQTVRQEIFVCAHQLLVQSCYNPRTQISSQWITALSLQTWSKACELNHSARQYQTLLSSQRNLSEEVNLFQHHRRWPVIRQNWLLLIVKKSLFSAHVVGTGW